jgi:hypothetical protein
MIFVTSWHLLGIHPLTTGLSTMKIWPSVTPADNAVPGTRLPRTALNGPELRRMNINSACRPVARCVAAGHGLAASWFTLEASANFDGHWDA